MRAVFRSRSKKHSAALLWSNRHKNNYVLSYAHGAAGWVSQATISDKLRSKWDKPMHYFFQITLPTII